MPSGPLLAVLVAGVVVAIAFSAYFSYQREATFARVATSLGLRFTERDDSAVRRLDLPLFHEGHAPSPFLFQTVGAHLLAPSTDRRPETIPGLLHALLDFRAHIPAFVASEYPAVR